MASRILETKLHAPPRRHGLVARRRLTDRLGSATASRLTLVSAPPGFGKTTLVADWLASRGPGTASAWLSLDATENDPASFWAYLVAALQVAVPDVGDAALRALQSPQPDIGFALRALLNDLAAVPSDVALVLDDFHLIDAREVIEQLAFVVDRLPARVHLILTTRSDPALPLARLRVRGDLVEIRAADLRFTSEEAAAYLNGTMGLELTAADVAALEARTEGWIAALQLAALSLHGRDDAASFIASFAGDDRYVVDYLADEVLARQPEDDRAFLLQTSTLERMTGPLCDAVTGRSDSRAVLERLDRANLFLVALDDQRRWYRYHHLFAEVLRARLLEEDTASVPLLHRRASVWLEENGSRREAISHALAGEDFERAAGLIEASIPEMRQTRAEVTVRRWLGALPAPVVEVRPVLAAAFAGALMQTGELARVGALLDAAERSLEPGRTAIVADDHERRRLPGMLGMLRAGQARIEGDLPGTVARASHALEVVTPGDHLSRGGSATLLGLALWERGDLDGAYPRFVEGMSSLEAAGHVSDVVGLHVTLADVRMAQGRLGEAKQAYERGLAIAQRPTGPPLRGAADMHVGVGDVLREQNDLAGADERLSAGLELGEENGLPKNPYRSRVALARVRQAKGDLPGAVQLLDAAEQVFFADFSPVVTPIPALRARVWITLGRLEPAWGWARVAQVGIGDDLDYVGQFAHATLARLLVADGRFEDALVLSDRLVWSAEDGGWAGAALDALVVQTLARHGRGDTRGAIESLGRAIELAEPEGYVRVFADEGRPMAALVGEAARRRLAPSYLPLLQRALTPGRTIPRDGLAEALSERELEVLRLLATELSGPEIASQLVVSLNTVRSHTKAVFAKLGVSSRRAAVRRGRELDLLTPGGR